jgi:small subunit ribosomal protein S3Ae
MAVGKNKRIAGKGKGKKGARRKQVDAFARKEWYVVKAPALFKVRDIGRTLVNKSAGNKLASEALKGRVFEASLADLQKTEAYAHRKMFLRCESVQGTNCLTNFYGMDFTTDKLRSLVRKNHTLIEAHIDVATTDGFHLRMFCIGFTKRGEHQTKKTSYAKSSQVRRIRAEMMKAMADAAKTDLQSLVKTLIEESLGSVVEKHCIPIFPVENVFVRRVKMIRAPQIDLGKLMDIHADAPVEQKGEAL